MHYFDVILLSDVIWAFGPKVTRWVTYWEAKSIPYLCDEVSKPQEDALDGEVVLPVWWGDESAVQGQVLLGTLPSMANLVQASVGGNGRLVRVCACKQEIMVILWLEQWEIMMILCLKNRK